MLHTSQGRVFIDPDFSVQNPGRYMARSRVLNNADSSFSCSADKMISTGSIQSYSMNRVAQRVPGSYMEYQLAVSATFEYVNAVSRGDPNQRLSDAMIAITTAINRVNEIYDRDLGIRLILIANNDELIEVVNSGNFTNEDPFALQVENQNWIDAQLGAGKITDYDLGHIFGTGGGGSAQINSVCSAGIKAMGATGIPNPTDDIFYIDFVAHELGHQFGAEHSFNGTTLACGGMNRVSSSAFEPGSGSTIMGYAGICGVEDIQANSDATFHAGSIAQIHAFTSMGGGCYDDPLPVTNNTDPINVDAGVERTIPVATAFRLKGSASDADFPADTLSYQWDQMDAGAATNANTLGDDLGSNALFRSYLPQADGNRDFPALGTQVVDGPYDQSETLPCTTRSLNFRLTVRDGKSGQASDDIQINVDSGSGPFRITSHNEPGTSIGQSTPSVVLTWAVANTNVAPVSCANVDIDLLTFSAGHNSYFETRLSAAPTPNDGAEVVTLPLPVQSNSRARFRVKCSNNIFYDISDTDIVIQANPVNGNYPVSGNTTFSNPNGLFATSSSCVPAPVTPVGGGGGGAFDRLWMIFLLSLMTGLRLVRNQPV